VARSIFYYTDSQLLGGAEEALFMLIEALDRSAWAAALLLDKTADPPLIARARELGVPIRLVTPMPLGLTGATRVPRFARTLRRDRPDVFHAQMSWPLAAKYALAAAVLARVPAVLGTVQLFTPYPVDRSNVLQLRALSRQVGRYIAVSRDTKRQLVDQLGWPADKIELVYNAVRSERFELPPSAELRSALTGGQDCPIVLTVARLDAQKGHHALIEAAAELPGVVFAFAGEGPERNALETRARTVGVADRVRFLGRRTDIPELLAACDVFALPSLYEGSSLAILEAMAAGRGIVTTAVPGTDELLTDGDSGLLVAPGDRTALAQALRRLLTDPGLRAALGARARERAVRDFAPAAMAGRVADIYRELLREPTVARLSEDRRNALLRRADWRFLLGQAERPAALNLAHGSLRQAVSLIADEPGAAGVPDLAVLSNPTREQLAEAYGRLAPGGELYCEWHRPRLGRVQSIRRTLAGAGFEDIRVHWPGPRPDPSGAEFWLPLDSDAAIARLLADRPPRRGRDRLLRRTWRLAHRAGALAPLCVVARRPGSEQEPQPGSWLLLTGGQRAINKVIGIPFGGAGGSAGIVKFARVPESEPGLARERDVLLALEQRHPSLPGVPRILADGRRVGQPTLTETAVDGTPLMSELTPASFPRLAAAVTDWLVALAAQADARPPHEWRERLIEQPLVELERQFGPVLEPGAVGRARRCLGAVGPLPLIVEHRDCAPWNILLTSAREPALLDWESAQASGLPLLDLVYFLANAAFVLEGALESGHTRDTYSRLLDTDTGPGHTAQHSIATYCQALGLDPSVIAPLRLLTWVVHCHSDYRHLEMDVGGPPGRLALEASVFFGLFQEELALLTRRG
jgi:glycosyltransferase involved in cell wall biosynthesis